MALTRISGIGTVGYQVYIQVIDNSTAQGLANASFAIIDSNGNASSIQSSSQFNNGWYEVGDPQFIAGTSNVLLSVPGYQSVLIDPISISMMNQPIRLNVAIASTVTPITTTPVTTVTTPVVTNPDPTPLDNTPSTTTGNNNTAKWVLIGIAAYLILK